MKTNTKAKTFFFLVVAGLFLVQDKLQEWFVPFSILMKPLDCCCFPWH